MHPQPTDLTQAFFENRQDIITFLKSRLQCAATAEDLSQEIYLKLHRIDPTAVENCRSYLFMMAANLISDSQRRETRRINFLNGATWYTNDEPTPEDIVVARAEINHLNCAVAELPRLTRQIFHANRFENKTQREIASQFGVSLSTVEYHIRKVLDHLASARDAFHQLR